MYYTCWKSNTIIGITQLNGTPPEPGFRAVSDDFLAAHCEEFEDTEENKLSYTPLHDQYVSKTRNCPLNNQHAPPHRNNKWQPI